MPNQQVDGLDELTTPPYFIFVDYKDSNGDNQTKRSKISDLQDLPGEEQEFLDEIQREGGEPLSIEVADSDSNGHFYRREY